MELDNGILQLDVSLSVILGTVVLFVGKHINDAVSFLREFSIPEPVTSGLIFALLIVLLYFHGTIFGATSKHVKAQSIC